MKRVDTDKGTIEPSPCPKGTANYGPDGGVQHFGVDMLPFFIFGNDGYGMYGDIFIDLFSGG